MTTELKTLYFMISRRKKIMVFADYVRLKSNAPQSKVPCERWLSRKGRKEILCGNISRWRRAKTSCYINRYRYVNIKVFFSRFPEEPDPRSLGPARSF